MLMRINDDWEKAGLNQEIIEAYRRVMFVDEALKRAFDQPHESGSRLDADLDSDLQHILGSNNFKEIFNQPGETQKSSEKLTLCAALSIARVHAVRQALAVLNEKIRSGEVIVTKDIPPDPANENDEVDHADADQIADTIKEVLNPHEYLQASEKQILALEGTMDLIFTRFPKPSFTRQEAERYMQESPQNG